jgi:hypothetical protein
VIEFIIKLISIVMLTFALALVVLGVITMWLERGQRRLLGVGLTAVGVIVGVGYGILGSRVAEALFGSLIVRVDLPELIATAFIYTAGVLLGAGIAVGLFLWATGRFRHQVSQATIALVIAGVAVALIATCIAVALSVP